METEKIFSPKLENKKENSADFEQLADKVEIMIQEKYKEQKTLPLIAIGIKEEMHSALWGHSGYGDVKSPYDLFALRRVLQNLYLVGEKKDKELIEDVLKLVDDFEKI